MGIKEVGIVKKPFIPELQRDYGPATCVICGKPYRKYVKNQKACRESCQEELQRQRLKRHAIKRQKNKERARMYLREECFGQADVGTDTN